MKIAEISDKLMAMTTTEVLTRMIGRKWDQKIDHIKYQRIIEQYD